VSDNAKTFPTYESIKVRPLINCRGTFTMISGSVILPEVRNGSLEATTTCLARFLTGVFRQTPDVVTLRPRFISSVITTTPSWSQPLEEKPGTFKQTLRIDETGVTLESQTAPRSRANFKEPRVPR